VYEYILFRGSDIKVSESNVLSVLRMPPFLLILKAIVRVVIEPSRAEF
jgi:hypothetical protein